MAGNGVHGGDQLTFTARAARTASHSRSATTATRSFSRTMRAPIPLIDDSSMETGPHPAVGGRMTRACSMPSTLTSVTYGKVPYTFSATTFCGMDWPTTVYVDGVFGVAWPLATSVLPYCLFHSSL